MRTTIAAMVGLLILTVFGGYAQCEGLQSTYPKQNYSPSAEHYGVELQVGKIFEVCKSGEVICPVSFPICDDLKVVNVVDTPDGLEYKGISPDTSLCSEQSAGHRRVFRITMQ
jgi:hypothetical protein